jgi:two-component system, LytTR family, sensor kinase
MLSAGAPELLHLVGYLTGATLYAMLFAMVARADRPGADRPDRLALATASLGLAWNVGELLLHVARGSGLTRAEPWLAAFAYTALGLLAAVVVHSVARTGGGDERAARPLTRAVPMLGYGGAATAGLLHLQAAARQEVLPSPGGLEIVTAGLILAGILLVIETRRHNSGRWPVWAMALAVFAVSALHLGRFHGADESWGIELIGHHASIPLAFAMLYRDYRFALADLFLKQALTLLALVALVLVGYAAIAPVLARGGPPAVALLLGAWAGTALLFPLVRHGVVWFVDRVVLARADTAAMIDDLAGAIETSDTTEAVLSRACNAVATALGAASVTSTTHAGGASLGAATPDPSAIVIATMEAPQFVLHVGPLAGGRRLLSGDVALVERVAALVARRIDALRLTEERYERMLREQAMTALATEAELRALRAQVNPHFLFNTLTTLGHLIQHAPPRALTTLMRLTTLLRGVLRSDGELTTLGRERELIRCYLDIEQERFEERLTIDIDIPDELAALPVPTLIVQPLVENAIKHGIARARLGGQVHVVARVDRSADVHALHISVTNTGAAPDLDAPDESNGVGLALVARRLRACYGELASVTLRRDEGAALTIAELHLPIGRVTRLSAPAATERLVS